MTFHTSEPDRTKRPPIGLFKAVERAGAVIRNNRTFRGPHGLIEATIFTPSGNPKGAAIAIHGWTLESTNMEPIALKLAEEGFVSIAINNPGAGKTDLGLGTNHINYVQRSALNAALILNTVKDELYQTDHNIKAFVAVGHSQGAEILLLAQKHLRGVLKLSAAALVSPVTGDPVDNVADGFFPYVNKLVLISLTKLTKLFGTDEITKRIENFVHFLMYVTYGLSHSRLWLSGPYHEATEANHQFWRHLLKAPKNVVAIGLEAMRRAGNEANEAFADMIKTTPTLILSGEVDKILDPETGNKLNATFAKTGFICAKTITGCGHFALDEKPVETIREIVAFFNAQYPNQTSTIL